jgi:hypothetical protein
MNDVIKQADESKKMNAMNIGMDLFKQKWVYY